MTKSRSTAVLRATKSSKPSLKASATPQKSLKAMAVKISLATPSKAKLVPKQDLGPGMYEIEAATSATKSRIRSAMMSKTSRTEMRSMAATGDLGPGAYDSGK